MILALETSCDDTCAALVGSDGLVRSSVRSSQDAAHARFGGVVPEIASRRHLDLVAPAVELALERAGASLANLVTMTVFITDMRYGDQFVRLRGEILKRDFPASALIGVSHLAPPNALLEIQAIAALD